MPGWAAALLVTLVIEVPIVAVLFRGERLRMVLVATVANAVTNLTLNLAGPRLPSLTSNRILIGEMLAFFVEAAVYVAASRRHDVPRSLLASGLGNLLSYAVGFTTLPRLFVL